VAKHTVRNTAPGPRGLHAAQGYIELAPGQTLSDVEMDDHEYESAKGTGNFHFDTAAKRDAKADQAATSGEGLPSNPMQLKQLAKSEGIDVGGATKAADLQAAILAGRKAKAESGTGGEQSDDLDNMSDDDLRATVQAITGNAPAADADRDTLLKLARGQ